MVLIIIPFLAISASASVYIDISNMGDPADSVLLVTDKANYTFLHDMNFSYVDVYDNYVVLNSSKIEINTTGFITFHYLATNVSTISVVDVLCVKFHATITSTSTFNVSGLTNGRHYRIEKDGVNIATSTASGSTISWTSDTTGVYEVFYDEPVPTEPGIGQYTWDLLQLMFMLVLLSIIIRLREEWF